MKADKRKQKHRSTMKKVNKEKKLIKVNIDIDKIPNFQNSYIISEAICQSIINKTISRVINESYINSISFKLTEHCIDYYSKKLSCFMNIFYIYHENDKNNEEQNPKIFYDFFPEEMPNHLIEIPQPSAPKIGRDHTTKVKIIKNKIEEKDEINDEENENKFELKYIKTYYRDLRKKYKIRKSVNLEKNEDYYNSQNKQKKVKKISVTNMTYTDLPKEEFINIYDQINTEIKDNYMKLEKEKEKIIEKEIINNEIQEKINAIKKKENEKTKTEIKRKKEIDTSRYTFDPNGNIINKISTRVDAFPCGFNISNLKISDLKIKRKSIYLLEDKITKLVKENINNLRDKNKNIKENTNLNIITDVITKNNEDNLDKKQLTDISKKVNIITKFRRKSLIDEISYKASKKENGIFYPYGGSNIELITPETGVIIHTEDEKIVKKGGFNYYNKYKKPSMKDYNELSERNIKLNKLLYSSPLINKNYSVENLEYVGFKKEFKDDNPLISNTNKMNEPNNMQKINNRFLMKNKSELLNYFNNKSFDYKSKRYNLDDNIKLSNNKVGANLYMLLSSDEDIENAILNQKNPFNSLKKINKNIYNSNDNIKIKKNIFFNKKKKDLFDMNNNPFFPKIIDNKVIRNNVNFYGKEYINKYNENIMNNNMWGNINDNNIELSFMPFKHKQESFGIENFFRKPIKPGNNKLHNFISNDK